MFKANKYNKYGRYGKRKSSKTALLMMVAPFVLDFLIKQREAQKAKRGRFYKARKRDQLLDTALNQASRFFGRRGRGFF